MSSELNSFNVRSGIVDHPLKPDKIKINRSYGFYDDKGSVPNSHDKGNSVPHNEGKWNKGFLSGRSIGQEWDGNIKTLKVPIGLWAMVSDDPGCPNTDPPSNIHGRINAYWGVGKFPELIGSEKGDYENNNTDKKIVKLTDANQDLATICAISKSKTNKLDFTGSDGKTPCWVSVTAKNGGGNCVKSGIHPGSFCQLGDNALSSEYCLECNDSSKETDPDHYCNWAKSRICNKGKTNFTDDDKIYNEKCIGNDDCDEWGVERNNCGNFCGTWENPDIRCLDGWGKYCQDPDNFSKNSDKCKRVWRRFQNYTKDGSGANKFTSKWPERACTNENKLTMDPSGNNIFNGVCGGLCTVGDEIDPGWCQDHVNEFCSTGDNVFTAVDDQINSCYKFLFNHPEKTRKSQIIIMKKMKDRLRNMKKSDGSFDIEKILNTMKMHSKDYLVENKLLDDEKIIPFLNKETVVGDYVGCLMGSDFYKEATRYTVRNWFSPKTSEETIKRLSDKIIAKTNVLPQCFFEFCKEGGIHDDNMDIKNCPICDSTIITEADTINMNESQIINKVTQICSLKPDPPPHSSDEPPKPTPGSSDKPPKPSPSSSVDPVKPEDPRKKMIMVGVGIIVFILLIILFSEMFGNKPSKGSASSVSTIASKFGKMFGIN